MRTNCNWKVTPARLVSTVLLLLALGLMAARVDAKETYKDDAGRVIYTIDDDGIVSMFESSPTDLTLSVTRGTREQMQPKVTEIRPESLQAGTSTMLQVRGKNLVGATVKFSVPGIEVGAYAGKPEVLDIPIKVPASTLPGEVTMEVSTPIGSTKTSFKITEMKIGGGGPVGRDAAGKPAVATSAPESCPEGMLGIAAERGGFCIEIDQSFSGDLRKAEKTCASAGKRLCSAAEWQTACEAANAGAVALKNMIGDWEWTGTPAIKDPAGADYGGTGDLNSILMGQADCKTNREYQTWRNENIAGRCCK